MSTMASQITGNTDVQQFVKINIQEYTKASQNRPSAMRIHP